MHVTCFYDYTCPYTHRAFRWLARLEESAAGFHVDWATFSLKEANREPGAPSAFEETRISSVSVLALALAHAARKADFPRYHQAVFHAMHEESRRPAAPELLELAARAGVDVAKFDRQRDRWLAAVADEHREGVRRFQVFGTPTLVTDDHAAVFLKLASTPLTDQDAELWHSLYTLARCHPELIEIKRPQ